jgi:hypothetical protein
MVLYCYSDGDPSVGIQGYDITVEVRGMKEEFFDPDDLGYIMTKLKEFAEDAFDDDFHVITENQIKDENETYSRMCIEDTIRDIEEKLFYGPQWFGPINNQRIERLLNEETFDNS